MYFKFPENFMFGAASSACQIESACKEGGKGEDVHEHNFSLYPEKYLNDDPNEGADFYHKYPEDIKMMKELGIKCFRFSISWSRIYPDGPENVCQAGLDYYSDLINKLVEADIVPFFDLWHCDLPQWVIERNGLLNPEFIDWFGTYAETCFKAFGDRVAYWSTINEPNVNVMAAYAWGSTAPFMKDMKLAMQANHNAVLAHYRAVRIFRELGCKGKIGVVVHIQLTYAPSLDMKDQEAAERDMSFYSTWWTDSMLKGYYPKNLMDYPYITDLLPAGWEKDLKENFVESDFLGINYYSSYIVGYAEDGKMDYEIVTGDKLPKDDYGFTINPQGIYDTIMEMQKRHPGLELIITENGIGKKRWGNYEEELDDDYRINYLREHLRAVSRAVEAGAPVTGYLHWSIMDTTELYGGGYSILFGLMQVRFDLPDKKRIPRKSFYYYQKIIAEKAVN